MWEEAGLLLPRGGGPNDQEVGLGGQEAGPLLPRVVRGGTWEEAWPILSGGRDLRPGDGAYHFQGRVPSYIFRTGGGAWSEAEPPFSRPDPRHPLQPHRWKGENVSTREVEGVLSVVDFLQEVNVYGVPVPGAEECTAVWEGRGLVPGGELPEPGRGQLVYVLPRV